MKPGLLKTYFKALTKKPAFRKGLGGLIASYIKWVHRRTQWVVVGDHYPLRYWENQKPFIVGFWHGRILMMACAWPAAYPFRMLISAHSDGQIIAHAMAHFGIDTIYGSSSSKGIRAFRQLIKSLTQEGCCIGMTPDGPRGPRQEVGNGMIRLAQQTGADIIPLGFSATRHRFLSTWDRFLVAFPGGKGAYVWGEPLSAQDPFLHVKLKKALDEVTEKADALCGIPK